MADHAAALWIPELLCLAVCLVATVTDLRSLRIPNWLTVPAVLVGLLLNTLIYAAYAGWRGALIGALSSIAGGLLLLVVFGLMAAVRFLGMGDVKLLTAVGVLLRWPTAIWVLAYVTLAGGVLALGYAIFRGQLGSVLGNIGRMAQGAVTRKRPDVALHRIPYAAAILVGSVWAVLAVHVPELRLGTS